MLYWVAEIFRRARHTSAAHSRGRDMTAVELVRLEQARKYAQRRKQERKAAKATGARGLQRFGALKRRLSRLTHRRRSDRAA
jgi:hypothetical protein